MPKSTVRISKSFLASIEGTAKDQVFRNSEQGMPELQGPLCDKSIKTR